MEPRDEGLETETDDYFLPESVSWEAMRNITDSMHKRRHIIIAIIGVVGTAVAIWQSSWLTFLAIALGLTAWEVADRFTYPVKAELDTNGLTLDGRHYTHTELTSFDIHRMPDQSYELSLYTKQWHLPHLRVPLGDQDPEEVYAILSQYVINQEHPTTFLDRWIGR